MPSNRDTYSESKTTRCTVRSGIGQDGGMSKTPSSQTPSCWNNCRPPQEAVERRLTGDNVGLLLSGGLDSSAILMHSSILRPDIPTFTVALDQHPMDESPFAARVAKVMGADNTIVRIQSQAVIDTLRGDQLDMGQPMPTPAAAIQFSIFQEIRNQVSVLLSGDGGDEVLAGRTMPQLAFRMAPSRRIGQLPGLAQRVVRGVSRRVDRKDWAAPHDNFGQARVIGGSRVLWHQKGSHCSQTQA